MRNGLGTTLAHKKGPVGFARLGGSFVAGLESFFYWLGCSIGKRPFFVTVGCLLIGSLFAMGLSNFTKENRPEKLWIPSDSQFVRDSEWMRSNFPNNVRPQFAIFEAKESNILSSQSLLEILSVIEEVAAIQSEDTTWDKICLKIPVVNLGQGGAARRRREATEAPEYDDFFGSDFDDAFNEDLFKKDDFGKSSFLTNFDPSVHLDRDTYCSFLDRMQETCWLSSLLEIWSYDRAKIATLSSEEISSAINGTEVSPVFGTPRDFSKSLGGIKFGNNGTIISAKTILVSWFVESDPSKSLQGKITNDAGTGDQVAKDILEWEAELIKVLEKERNGTITTFTFAGRSFGDISGKTIQNDAQKLSVGFIIMFLYVQLMLGRFNLVEQRALLSLIGIASVAIGCVVSYGVCSAFSIPYGPVHNILPFLMLGIGIDDMFVIAQCWATLGPETQTLSLPERLGLTLKHAGVSITITSLTDFTAFAIGATTVLPSLRSFCIYAAVGILATYILQATFFTAWFSLDLRRIESNRDGCFFCIQYKNYKPNDCSKKDFFKSAFDKILGSILFKTPVKILVLLSTGVLLIVGSWGLSLLRQEFDPVWFLTQSSYLFKYFDKSKQYYPGDGEPGNIFLSGFNHSEHLDSIANLIQRLQEQKDIIKEVDAWYPPFQTYSNVHFNTSLPVEKLDDARFKDILGKFLFSPSGSKYRRKFMFFGTPRCRKPAPPVKISSFDFKFRKFKGSFEHVPAMNRLKKIISEADFGKGAEVKVWARAFAGWETDEVIAEELLRNLSCAMVCVFFTTLLLIVDIKACLLVLLCVVLTLIDVSGMMHFWGLTVDVVSCIDLVLAIGLCVDYAAHIGHSFMTFAGSRQERAIKTVKQIGPAVFNGGFSTFLAFILLADSDSHVFSTYFKIFFLVVVFGLFHGLVFLPVVLSLVGPAPYAQVEEASSPQKLPMNVVAASSDSDEPPKQTELSPVITQC
ncbi:protein patched homolog 2-like [Neocloeon triangulifer]|uniref:protein patched homolog 2-like n=1 Tax=Neocloeon triangulifer TaxID=2078957 RepID=UPI00286EC545|nr:protein patched homolog 2-like [Neocloeon triangulifer]